MPSDAEVAAAADWYAARKWFYDVGQLDNGTWVVTREPGTKVVYTAVDEGDARDTAARYTAKQDPLVDAWIAALAWTRSQPNPPVAWREAVERFIAPALAILALGAVARLSRTTSLDARKVPPGVVEATVVEHVEGAKRYGEVLVDKASSLEALAGVLADRAALRLAEATRAHMENAVAYHTIHEAKAVARIEGEPEEGPPLKSWITRLDNRVRPAHRVMHGVEVPYDEDFDVDGYPARYPGDPRLPPELRINCLLDNQPVGIVGLRRAFRSWYEGQIIRVHTSGGEELAGTVNHPVLTLTGWKPMGSLQVGDQLICASFDGGDIDGHSAPHVDHRTAAEVYDSLAATAQVERVPLVAVDFHGDIPHSDVDVVTADGELLREYDPAPTQGIGEFVLASAEVGEALLSGSSPELLAFVGVDRSTPGDVRSAHPGQPLSGGGVGVAGDHGLGAVAQLDPVSGEQVVEGVTAGPLAVGDGLDGLTVEVALDEVEAVVREDWSGHVYTFEAVQGWFTASNIVTRNCRCRLSRVVPKAATAGLSMHHGMWLDVDTGEVFAAKPKRDRRGRFAKTAGGGPAGGEKVKAAKAVGATPGGKDPFEHGKDVLMQPPPTTPRKPDNPAWAALSPKVRSKVEAGDGTKANPFATRDVDTAVALLEQGHDVRLHQPKQVAVLMDRMDAIVKDAEARGNKAPSYNLCRVHVPKTNLFCEKSKAIPRMFMPQLTGEPTPGTFTDKLPKKRKRNGKVEVDLGPDFEKYLSTERTRTSGPPGHTVTRRDPIKVTRKKRKCSELKATQTQLKGGQVAGMMKANVPPGEIWVTRDGYIIDGHHRWAMQTAKGFRDDNPDIEMDVIEVDEDIIQFCAIADNYTASRGLKPKTAESSVVGVYLRLRDNRLVVDLPGGVEMVVGAT